MIKLKKDNVLREPLYDDKGNDTGFEFVFDMEDIELPLRIDQAYYEHRKNLQAIKNQLRIIDKKEDRKKDGVLTWKQREGLLAYKEYYEKDIKAMDMIIGEGKTKEFLKVVRRKPYYSMFDDICELLEPLMPKLKSITEDITDKIKEKYDTKEENTLE